VKNTSSAHWLGILVVPESIKDENCETSIFKISSGNGEAKH
jgi:hypothetical protein